VIVDRATWRCAAAVIFNWQRCGWSAVGRRRQSSTEPAAGFGAPRSAVGVQIVLK